MALRGADFLAGAAPPVMRELLWGAGGLKIEADGLGLGGTREGAGIGAIGFGLDIGRMGLVETAPLRCVAPRIPAPAACADPWAPPFCPEAIAATDPVCNRAGISQTGV